MTGKVGVQALVPRDQLVGEGQSGHQGAFLEPEDGAEGPREEDALNSSEGDQSLMEGPLIVHPLHGPLRLLADDVDIGNGGKEVALLVGVLDVGIDEQRVGLGVHVLHGYLEAIEAACLGDLHLRAKLLRQILKHDSIRGGEEGEHVFDEMLLLFVEFLPVLEILVEIDLIGGPEGGEMLLVHLEDGVVLDGEEHEPLLIFLEDGLLDLRSSEGGERSHHGNLIDYSAANLYQISSHFTGTYNLF
jgi:hypothetical protein